ncbi:DegV family protein [Paludicola sp. MB14-C6]|uniref:DegV family protein n=1 Tax=Paludihabitans sp. MB14-C6 TaxID=3070656 RepID=UPI0027DBAC37|nr:DegV family protein [Paludicola sp. MB14-C6]WMJ22315.1 DegV family protein [Paludicola sp. MB14-C6]
MDYRIIADSCCEFTSELKEEVECKSVPLKMTLGNDTYVDDENLDVNHFLKTMNHYKGRAMSACPSPQEYYNEYASDKPNYVVTLSSQLSGSYSSAMVAKMLAEEDDKEVEVFDSKSASAGELLVSLKIKECMDNGLSKNELITKTQEFIKGMKTFFVLENLDNLMKNGRMSLIAAKIATVMHIRAILGSDGEGNIAFFDKARGTSNAIQRLVDMIGEQCKDTANKVLAISHCNNETQALRVKKLAQEKYSFKDILIVKTRGLSSMYANQGGVIIAF